MIVVLSPAKTLDFTTPTRVRQHTEPALLKDAGTLARRMRRYSADDLVELMGISRALAELNEARFAAWKNNSPDTRQAVLAFKGDVYTGLDATTLRAADLKFAQKHLRILSGLYGILRPLDLMLPYRLEMGTALETSRGADLYAFWGKRIARALNTQAAVTGSRHLINLASNEYFRVVDPGALDLDVITPVFKDRKNDQYKVISFFAKKARGMMARFIIDHRIRRVEALQDFGCDGYRFDASLSQTDKLVFTRDSHTTAAA